MDKTSLPNKAAGLALMTGALLLFVASMLTPGRLNTEPEDLGNLRVFLELMVENSTLAHVSGLLTILAAALLAFGLSALLRLPREPGLAGLALRIGVGTLLFAWGVFIIEMGMRHMAIHIVTHGIDPAMSQAARDVMGLGVISGMVGMHFGFIALIALGAFLTGLSLAARFSGFSWHLGAAYALALVGVAGVIDLIVIQHIHDLDFGALIVISNLLLYLSAALLAVIGLGIFRERRELVPEGG